MATRYHLLPSEVLRRADTLDFLVMDVAISYQNYLHEKEESKSHGAPPRAPDISVNTLQQMIERVRR